MVETKHMTDKHFKRLTNNFSECCLLYQGLIGKTDSVLVLVSEINYYIREKGGIGLRSVAQLDEIRRDISIYRSRMVNLEKSMTILKQILEDIGKARKVNNESYNIHEQIGIWFDSYNKWHADRKEFNSQFNVAEAKWFRIEDEILRSSKNE